MTTPQGELQRLSDKINRLYDLFDSEENDYDLLTRIAGIDIQTEEIIKRMDMLQDQMSLIIKLLSKPQ